MCLLSFERQLYIHHMVYVGLIFKQNDYDRGMLDHLLVFF